MKALSVFMPYIMPHVMSCPRSAARQALVSAAIEFCEKSNVVQRTLDAFGTRDGVREYSPPVPRHQAVALVLAAWFKGNQIEVVPQSAIANPQAYRDSIPGVTAQSGDPQQLWHLGTNLVGLHPTPDETEASVLTLRAAMKPTRAATQLEDVLFEDWAEVLAAGALARLHEVGGQPYTDLARASARRLEFQRGINRARIEGSRGRVQVNLVAQMRPFA